MLSQVFTPVCGGLDLRSGDDPASISVFNRVNTRIEPNPLVESKVLSRTTELPINYLARDILFCIETVYFESHR